MPSVYIEENKKRKRITLSFGEYASIIYHDMFEFPLSFDELSKWSISEDYLFSLADKEMSIKKVDYEGGYFYLGDDKQKIHKRALRNESSDKKLQTAYKAANLLAIIPSVLFVGITGSLAMSNADEDSDIDLMIITTGNALWLSRLFSILILKSFGLKIRRKKESEQKDRICANIWITENNLSWDIKNIFTAHEIIQIKPLLNKNNVFEKFLYKNRWVYKYFPKQNKHNTPPAKKKYDSTGYSKSIISLTNRICFYLQFKYMEKYITNEKISLDKALFHPVPLSNYVEKRFMQSYLSD